MRQKTAKQLSKIAAEMQHAEGMEKYGGGWRFREGSFKRIYRKLKNSYKGKTVDLKEIKIILAGNKRLEKTNNYLKESLEISKNINDKYITDAVIRRILALTVKQRIRILLNKKHIYQYVK